MCVWEGGGLQLIYRYEIRGRIGVGDEIRGEVCMGGVGFPWFSLFENTQKSCSVNP